MEGLKPESRPTQELLQAANEVRDRIQFPVLVELFNKKLGRAGQVPREFSSADIGFDPLSAISTYDGKIVLGLAELFPEGHPATRLELLIMIIHEMAHHFSLGKNEDGYTEHGVSSVVNATGESFTGEAINEAITELTAMEIARIYIEQTGDREYFLGENLDENLIAKIGQLSYPKQIAALATTIARVADEAGVPEDTVWGAFQHAYYNNTDIASGDIYRALKAAVGKEAAYQLVNTNAEHMADPQVISGLLERLKPKEAEGE